jgi:hypothetical protein
VRREGKNRTTRFPPIRILRGHKKGAKGKQLFARFAIGQYRT